MITLKGVVYPEPKLQATIFDDKIDLGDIKIFGENQNKGYGSILMNCLKELAEKYGVFEITGFIAGTDDDHIDRITHFYKKHDFVIENNRINWRR